jgi:hypothetical protein
MLTEHGTVERPPLLEGRSMYIVMGPLEKRVEKKTDGADGAPEPDGDTIGDAVAAKASPPAAAAEPAPAPEPEPEPTTSKPAEQG